MSDSNKPISTGQLLAQFVGRTASSLSRRYAQDEPSAVRRLAQLRNALGQDPGTDLATWEILDSFPEELRGRGDDPSRYESAAMVSLALFAWHQQSRRDVAMHQPGTQHTLGRALRVLAGGDTEPDKALTRRFVALGTSPTLDAALPQLRGLISQLRQARIPLDYGQLNL